VNMGCESSCNSSTNTGPVAVYSPGCSAKLFAPTPETIWILLQVPKGHCQNLRKICANLKQAIARSATDFPNFLQQN
jgi:hypothetical protein